MSSTMPDRSSTAIDAIKGAEFTASTRGSEIGAVRNAPETKAKPVADRRQAILVLGMHRSGTSAMTRVISLLGADLPSNLMPAVKGNNEVGFWESIDAYRLNDEIFASVGSRWDNWQRFNPDWVRSIAEDGFEARALEFLAKNFAESSLFVFKDPRLCRLLPFWLEVLCEFGAEIRCILPIRNPLEVAASLEKRDGFSPAKSHMLWLRYALDAEHETRGLNRAVVSYDELLGDWRATIAKLSDELGIVWPRRSTPAEVEIDRFLDHRHRHHAMDDASVRDHPEVANWVKEGYSTLIALKRQANAKNELERLNEIRLEFNRASDALGVIVRTEEMAREEVERANSKLESRIGELEAEVAQHVARIGELESDLAALIRRKTDIPGLEN